MSLSREEIEYLQEHLDECRKKGQTENGDKRGTPTSDDTVLVLRSRFKTGQVYHAYSEGTPACGTTSNGTYRKENREDADAWASPCGHCYPDEVDGQ